MHGPILFSYQEVYTVHGVKYPFAVLVFFALVLSTFVVNLRTVHIYIVLWVQFIAYNCMIIKLTCINRHLQ